MSLKSVLFPPPIPDRRLDAALLALRRVVGPGRFSLDAALTGESDGSRCGRC